MRSSRLDAWREAMAHVRAGGLRRQQAVHRAGQHIAASRIRDQESGRHARRSPLFRQRVQREICRHSGIVMAQRSGQQARTSRAIYRRKPSNLARGHSRTQDRRNAACGDPHGSPTRSRIRSCLRPDHPPSPHEVKIAAWPQAHRHARAIVPRAILGRSSQRREPNIAAKYHRQIRSRRRRRHGRQDCAEPRSTNSSKPPMRQSGVGNLGKGTDHGRASRKNRRPGDEQLSSRF